MSKYLRVHLKRIGLFLGLFVLLPTLYGVDTLRVGPTRLYKVPSKVEQIVKNGDVILIDSAQYSGDVVLWNKSNLLIKGVGGRPHLMAAGKHRQGKAIWIVAGNNITIENIEFSGAAVPDKNGAGIRLEANNFTVRNSYFHDNENGILTGANDDVLIEYCHFARNGANDGYTHNVYVGHGNKLTFRYNYTHGAVGGQNLKSRAKTNYILYNRIMDEKEGTSSYNIDLSNGGLSYIIGNTIHQGANAPNGTIVRYGAEGLSNPIKSVYIINNTIVNERSSSIFIDINSSASKSVIMNNLFVGNGTDIKGPATKRGNLKRELSNNDITSLATYNFKLKKGSAAIDAGILPATGDGFNLTPGQQYLHEANKTIRKTLGTIDIGAFEYGVVADTSKADTTKEDSSVTSIAVDYTLLRGNNGVLLDFKTFSQSLQMAGQLSEQLTSLTLYSLSGNLVRRLRINPNEQTAALGPLPKGSYVMVFVGERGTLFRQKKTLLIL